MRRYRTPAEIAEVLALKAQGLSDREVSSATGVSIHTIRTWRKAGIPRRARPLCLGELRCPDCGDDPHDPARLPAAQYAYLLGLYLGDGCVARNRNSWTLRITLDVAYPRIIEESLHAVSSIRGRQARLWNHRGMNCITVASS